MKTEEKTANVKNDQHKNIKIHWNSFSNRIEPQAIKLIKAILIDFDFYGKTKENDGNVARKCSIAAFVDLYKLKSILFFLQ